MKTEVHRKNPETRWGFPIWCHHHCIKMKVKKFDKLNKLLVISSNAAEIKITQCAALVDEGWYIDWEVRHSQDIRAGGRIYMTTEELRAAFGISDTSGKSEKW